MKARNSFLTMVSAVVLTTGSVWAQHNHNQTVTPSAAASSESMAAECQHHMSEAKEVVAKLDAAVADAQQADTAQRRQAALADVRSLVDQLKKHINMCPMMQSKSMQDTDDMDCMRNETQKDSTKN
jgi:small-conductance mechanosensitive channel